MIDSLRGWNVCKVEMHGLGALLGWSELVSDVFRTDRVSSQAMPDPETIISREPSSRCEVLSRRRIFRSNDEDDTCGISLIIHRSGLDSAGTRSVSRLVLLDYLAFLHGTPSGRVEMLRWIISFWNKIPSRWRVNLNTVFRNLLQTAHSHIFIKL